MRGRALCSCLCNLFLKLSSREGSPQTTPSRIHYVPQFPPRRYFISLLAADMKYFFSAAAGSCLQLKIKKEKYDDS